MVSDFAALASTEEATIDLCTLARLICVPLVSECNRKPLFHHAR